MDSIVGTHISPIPASPPKSAQKGYHFDSQRRRPAVTATGRLRCAGAGSWVQQWNHSLWLFNIVMGNGPFIDGLPFKNGDFPWLCYFLGLCKGISPENMAKHMVLTYLHFRILKFPLGWLVVGCRWRYLQ